MRSVLLVFLKFDKVLVKGFLSLLDSWEITRVGLFGL